MSTNRTPRVVVATSGSEASRSAITRAAHEAAARGASLEIVHVVPPSFSGGPAGDWAEPALRNAGRDVLTEGERLAQAAEPSLEIRTCLLTGSRPDGVVHASQDADLLVIGTPPHDLVGRLWSGPAVVGIAARAGCPVLIVPPDAPTGPARVLLGLASREHSDRLLRTAFALARQSQSELRILHAWHFVSPYEEAIAERLPTPQWEETERRAIEAQITDLRMTYPEVQVQVAVVHGHPAPILVRESRDAGVLVISRPAHGGYAHHLGFTARAVIRQSECPVLVVPPRDDVAARHADAPLAS